MAKTPAELYDTISNLRMSESIIYHVGHLAEEAAHDKMLRDVVILMKMLYEEGMVYLVAKRDHEKGIYKYMAIRTAKEFTSTTKMKSMSERMKEKYQSA